MNREQVIEAVRERLANVGHGISFEIIEAGVRQDGEWWYVPVIANGPKGQTLTHEMLVNTYANVEEDVSEALDTNVLVIPAVA
jgi:hypothetical protein